MDNNNSNYQNIPNNFDNNPQQNPNNLNQNSNNGIVIDSNLFNNNQQSPVVKENLEDQKYFNNQESRYINNNIAETTMTFDKSEVYSMNNLNITDNYNGEIKETISNQETPKKATIKITSEAKTFLLIIAIIFIFIIFLPTIFDFINNIKYQ